MKHILTMVIAFSSKLNHVRYAFGKYITKIFMITLIALLAQNRVQIESKHFLMTQKQLQILLKFFDRYKFTSV